MKLSNIQMFLLRLVIGGFFLSTGIHKYKEGWLTNAEPLRESLVNYHQQATGPQLRYLNVVAIPYAGSWAKAITLGELALAASLLLGLLVRFSSFLGIVMVMNLHAATGNLFTLNFFGSTSAAPLVVGLVVLMLSGAGRWGGVDALLAKSNSKSFLW